MRSCILHRPVMYIGSMKHTSYDLSVLSNMKNAREKVMIPAAIEKLFQKYSIMRVIIQYDLVTNKSVTIEITLTDTDITITNGGLLIPINKHPTCNKWIPELLFGTLQTSSSYEISRIYNNNGVGQKDRFTVIIYDAIRRLKYA